MSIVKSHAFVLHRIDFWIFIVYCLISPSQLSAQHSVGAASIAICDQTGKVGIGYSDEYHSGIPTDSLVANNLGKSQTTALENCIAAGGLHGSCEVAGSTAQLSGYSEEYRCLSIANVELGHEPVEQLAGATSSWDGYRGHGATAASAASMTLERCRRTTDAYIIAEETEEPDWVDLFDGEAVRGIKVRRPCRVAATVCLK